MDDVIEAMFQGTSHDAQRATWAAGGVSPLPGDHDGGWGGGDRGSRLAGYLDPGVVDLRMDSWAAAWGAHAPWGSDAGLLGGAGMGLRGPVIGTPELDAHYWQPQTTAFTCAVQAQRGIIEAFTGQPISEAQLVYDATAHGWLTNRGMSPHDVGNLLELYGIPCHVRTGATIGELMAELAQGHKVIVGVDAGEMWRQDHPLEDFFQQSADHAIWVTGIDFSDPAHPKVIINDSGDPTGAGKAYDLALFKDAWRDSGFFYVATDHAPPGLAGAADPQPDRMAEMSSALADYFSQFYDDFRHCLQQRAADPTPVAPSDVMTVFTDAAVRAFIAQLPDNPLAALDEQARHDLFRAI